MAPELNDLLWIAWVVYLLAGTIKGIIGIGLPMAAIGLMSQLTEPLNAIALVIVPMMVTNLWQIYRSGFALRTLKRYYPFATMLCVFIYISSSFAARVPANVLLICVGVVITVFAIDALWRKAFVIDPRFDLPAQLCAGVFGGMMGGVAGVWSPPMVAYLLACQVDKDEFVRALGFLIFSGSVFLCIGYIHADILTPPMARLSAIMIVPGLLGFALGEKIRRTLDAVRFRKVVLVFFMLMGLNLIRRDLL